MSVTLTPEMKMALQRALVPYGYDDVIDGRFGEHSQIAMRIYQAQKRPDVTPTGLPTEEDLFDLGILQRPVKGHFNMNIGPSWFSGIVGSTIFKYVVAIAATFIAAKLGLDPISGKATIEGVIAEIFSIGMAAWGAHSAAQSKVVVNGTVVKVNDMAPADKKAVVEAVAATKEVPVAEVLKK